MIIMPKVSIIVPCWGVEKYLDRCVESLVNQTLKDIEIILVDDVSPDRVPEMCDEWARKDDRIVVVHKKENGGLGYARNAGLEVATGEYIMFIDSDDTYDKSACERMYSSIKVHDADVASGIFNKEISPGIWKNILDVAGNCLLESHQINDYILDFVACAPGVRTDRLHPVSVCLLCTKLEIIKKYNLKFYSEREVASEDTLFKMALLQKCKRLVCIDYPFYNYYLNNASLTHSFSPKVFENIKKLRLKMIDILGDNDKALLRIDRFIISDIRMMFTRLVKSNYPTKLQFIKGVLCDDICKELKIYKPSYLGWHARLCHLLCIKNMPYSLFIYIYIINTIKKIVKN